MKEKVLVFAPHPDDEVIGCGGSIVKHLLTGREVFVVFGGNTTTIDCAHMSRKEYIVKRKTEIPRATRILGILKKNLFFLKEKPWQYNEERLRFNFLDMVRKVKPKICYLPHNQESHPDHKIVASSALDAILMAPSPWFRKFGDTDECLPVEIVLAYEVWTPIESPNYFEALDEEILEKKMKALREYKTQEVGKYEHAYRGINAYRGAIHEGKATKYAEAFQIIKTINLFSF